MRRITLLLTVLLLAFTQANAQLTFSLKEAQDYAAKNAFNAQRSQLDVDAARSKIWETIAIGLPQINAEGGYNHNVVIPTTLIPADAFSDPKNPTPTPTGVFIPVKFGVRHNVTSSITGTQLLFNGSYIVGLQATRAYAELSTLQKERTEIQVRQEVSSAYFLVIAANENVSTLEKSAVSLEQTYKDTRALYENGLTEEQAADQVKISLTNLQNSLENAQQQLIQAKNLLKFQMGLPQTTEIILSDSMESLTLVNLGDLIETTVDYSSTIDFRLASQGTRLQKLNLKNERAGYLPTLAMFATQQANGFSGTFNFSTNTPFYPATIVGFKLNVPLVSSGMKHQKVVQAKIELNRAKISETQAKEGIALEQQNARINYKFQLKNFDNQKENLALADRIKSKTLIKFQEGVASSFELAQSETQYLQAQGGYIQAVVNLLNAKVQFQKAFNQLH